MNSLKESFGRFWGWRRGRGPYGEPLPIRERGMGWPWPYSEQIVGVGPSPVYLIQEPKPIVAPHHELDNKTITSSAIVIVGVVAAMALIIAIVKK